MPIFRVAHLNQDGENVIVIPLESAFSLRSTMQQKAIRDDLQSHAVAANLAGIVVPVWDVGGRMEFLAPSAWRSFFQSVTLSWVVANLNRNIRW